jgi:hypothetical protein
MNTIKDIAGRTIKEGDVVAYAAKSHLVSHTSLYIVHRITTVIEDRGHRTYNAQNGDWGWEKRPTEIVTVLLRGFKQSWWDKQNNRAVRTYVRQIFNPNTMVLISDLSFLQDSNPLHAAIKEYLGKQGVKVASWPFPV